MFIPRKVPPFKPANRVPMVVMTVRMPPQTRDKLKLLWRTNASFESVSHVIQTAVEEFLAKNA